MWAAYRRWYSSFPLENTQRRVWQHFDAKGQIMGRMATHIAEALMGKNKVNYDPSADCGDYVVVTNFKDVVLSGRKKEQKLYRRHSMIPGGLKEVPFSRMFDERPEQILKKALAGMLPKNLLRRRRLARLHVFMDEDHPYKQNIVKNYLLTTLYDDISDQVNCSSVKGPNT